MKLWKRLIAGLLAAATITAAGTAASADSSAERDYTKYSGLYPLNGWEAYVNGKDFKNSEGNYDSYYKSVVLQYAGRTLGTQLKVAVLPDNYVSVSDFAALFRDGKIDAKATQKVKDIASARIDANGRITVSAKKKVGRVNVWVYEVVDKKLVWSGDNGLGEKFGINPNYADIAIYMAPSGITYTTDPSRLSWEKPTGREAEMYDDYYGPTLTKSDKSLTLQAGGDPVTVYLADKKVTVEPGGQYYIENIFDPSVIEVG